jgi:hypothetical protein
VKVLQNEIAENIDIEEMEDFHKELIDIYWYSNS